MNLTFEVLIFAKSFTVNVVIFAGGKFRENVTKTFHVGVIFKYSYFLNKVIWVLFSRRRQYSKKYENCPIQKFNIYSTIK